MSDQDSARTAFADGFRTFLAHSPTSYHAAEAVAARLTSAGFTRLDERDQWPSEAGRYVVVRDGAVIAWVVPEGATATTPLRVIGAHTDSPGFRLKPTPDFVTHGWQQAGVEIYGGPLLSTWFDRDLAVAGRVFDRSGRAHLVRTGAIARIPNLAIHLDRGANSDHTIGRQRETAPVIGAVDAVDGSDGSDTNLIGYVAARAGLEPADVTGADLFLTDTQPAALLGTHEEFLAAGRLDNLTSVYAALAALAAVAGGSRGERLVATSEHISVFAAFDHEEVGSATRSGAAGPFLEEVLLRIAEGRGATTGQRLQSWADSWVLSSDAGHLVHPNHVGKHDPEHLPRPGQGPLLKVNAQQRYATDGAGEALWHGLAEAAGVAVQTFVSNNDVPCGSTIGPITATRLGLRTVDVGVGLLSMHSVREQVHLGDLRALSQLIATFMLAAEERNA
ncbi:MAG: M18 family aminopeptidase [Pseudoclavibacter sp.]